LICRSRRLSVWVVRRGPQGFGVTLKRGPYPGLDLRSHAGGTPLLGWVLCVKFSYVISTHGLSQSETSYDLLSTAGRWRRGGGVGKVRTDGQKAGRGRNHRGCFLGRDVLCWLGDGDDCRNVLAGCDPVFSWVRLPPITPKHNLRVLEARES